MDGETKNGVSFHSSLNIQKNLTNSHLLDNLSFFLKFFSEMMFHLFKMQVYPSILSNEPSFNQRRIHHMQKNQTVAWGIQDLFLKIESLEVLEIPFTVTKVIPEELQPLSQFIIEFDVVELPANANISPVSFID